MKRDLRLDKVDTYAGYYHINFRTYVGQVGDSYDRYLLRMNEMAESLYIATQVAAKLSKASNGLRGIKPLKLLESLNRPSLARCIKKHEYASMEKLIEHFKH